MDDYEKCKFYLRGECSHKNAPDPYHSDCIGQDSCNAWEDNINCKSKTLELKR